MAIYDFYLCTLGGGASSFEAFALGSDAEAPARALKMLRDHPGGAYITMWDDKRAIRERPLGALQGDPEPALSVFE